MGRPLATPLAVSPSAGEPTKQAVVRNDAPQHPVALAAERAQRLQVRFAHHPQSRQLPRHVG